MWVVHDRVMGGPAALLLVLVLVLVVMHREVYGSPRRVVGTHIHIHIVGGRGVRALDTR